jgi:tetratricopeptide (TPR) repeat protein
MIAARRKRRLATAVLLAGGLAFTLGVERRSMERANRLHRAGDPAQAAALYRDLIGADTGRALVHYNLGTALLALGSPAAEPELLRAVAGERDDVFELRRRALYNLGVWNLERALAVAAAPDSVREHATRAVDANKDVLRLLPGDARARWNLALAQRLLDSLDAPEGRPGPESADPSSETDRLVLSDEVRELENVSEVTDAPRQGANEAPGSPGDLEPLSPPEAEAILGRGALDSSAIIGKLLAFEGRARRPFRTSPQLPRW